MEKRFKKESKIYLLKNKDIPVLRFENEKKIDNTKLGDYPSYRFRHIQILYEDLLPKGYTNTTDSSELKHWIEQRKIPKIGRTWKIFYIINSKSNNESEQSYELY